jgi:hypothetical protein
MTAAAVVKGERGGRPCLPAWLAETQHNARTRHSTCGKLHSDPRNNILKKWGKQGLDESTISSTAVAVAPGRAAGPGRAAA